MDTGELLHRLGHREDTKLCIISCDNLGFSHSFNVGILEALRSGIATTARLILNAPWTREVISLYHGEDLGVALLFTSDHEIFRMAPLTQSPTLVDGTGELPVSLEEFWEHGDTAEVKRECRAQIERAIYYGFQPSHIASESQALTLRPEFFDVLLDVAEEFSLPLRIPAGDDPSHSAFPAREIAASAGVISPTMQDCTFDCGPNSQTCTESSLENAVSTLKAGVTEISFRPAIASTELKALMGQDWMRYSQAHLMLTSQRATEIFRDNDVIRLGYRELKKVQSEIASSTED